MCASGSHNLWYLVRTNLLQREEKISSLNMRRCDISQTPVMHTCGPSTRRLMQEDYKLSPTWASQLDPVSKHKVLRKDLGSTSSTGKKKRQLYNQASSSDLPSLLRSTLSPWFSSTSALLMPPLKLISSLKC